MSQIDITTSQNVNITFTLASVGERFVAFVIDNFIKLAFMIILYWILFKLFNFSSIFDGMDDWSVAAVLGIITLPVHLYTLILESMMEGQTFGKKIMKIKVVKIDGYQAGFGDYLIRWIFRLIDVFLTTGIAAVLSIIISKNNQRLGGIASGTAVITLKNNVNISHTILENISVDYVPTFPQVILLSDNDVRIIKENFQKSLQSDDRVIIQRLNQKIKEILKMEYDEKQFTQRQFIATVIKDYNYYTGKEN